MMRHATESQGRRARVVVGVSALVAAFTPIAIPVPAAAQLTPADSLQIIQKVVQIRTGWMNRQLKFQACSVFEFSGRPSDLRAAFPGADRTLDLPDSPCPPPDCPYPSAVITDLEVAGDSVVVSVAIEEQENIHEEVFVVREDPSPSRTWWYVDSVRAFGFVRIRRPWIEGCRGPGVSRTMSDDPPSIARSVYLHNARDRHPDR